jgi:predicted transcriptional regulator
MGALLIQDDGQLPAGVISKTDLMVAYHHGVSPASEAHGIMTTPAHTVPSDAYLATAIQQMLVRDVQRLFVVHCDPPGDGIITGVLALSDAARFRSGSCRACTAGRLMMS